MTSGHIWGPITRETDLYTGLKLFLSKIYIVFCALKQFQYCQTCKSKSMSLWFRHIFTKKGKIQVQGSTLKANKTYGVHFVAKIFVVTQSGICGQKMNPKYICRNVIQGFKPTCQLKICLAYFLLILYTEAPSVPIWEQNFISRSVILRSMGLSNMKMV